MVRRSNSEIGGDWEKEVKAFFNEELCFENVDGGANFRPGGRQIDVVAGIHNVLFIGECKTKQELGRSGQLKKEIEDFRTLSAEVINALKTYRDKKYAKYNHYVLFFATKDIVWSEQDQSTLYSVLNNTLPARQFDEHSFDYYRAIIDELSAEIAKIHLLSDMGVKFPPQEALEIPAFKNKIKGLTIYNFVITPQNLLQYVSVARRETKIKEYYQRMISGARCQSIINYLDGPDQVFKRGKLIPGNIILATRPNTIIEELENISLSDTEFTKIKLPAHYGSLWVVDGQHRLYAYSKNSTHKPQREPCEEDKIFVTLIHDSSSAQQRQIFVDINKEQKGVDLNYIIDIEADANPQSYMGKISRLIRKIDKLKSYSENGIEYNNIFYSKIKIPSHGLGKRKYSLKGLYDAIDRKKLLSNKLNSKIDGNDYINPFFYGINHEDTEKVEFALTRLSKYLVQYFSIAYDVLGTELENSPNPPRYTLKYFLDSHMKEGIVSVLIGLFERITVAKCYKLKSSNYVPQKDDFEKYLLPISEALKNITSKDDLTELINTIGQGNRENTVRKLCKIIKDAGYPEFNFYDLDDDLITIVNQTKQLEVKLRNLINAEFIKEFGVDWCKGKMTDVLPGRIFETVKGFRKTDIERNPNLIKQGKLYSGLTLGLSKDLILMHWESLFSEIFVVGGNNKFVDRNQFSEALKLLELYRNSEFHGMIDEEERKIIQKPNQKRLAESYIKIFNSIFTNIEEKS